VPYAAPVTADGVTVRPFEERDIPAALDLLDAAFGGWPGRAGVDPEAHLRWKLASHPRAHEVQFVAEADGRLVGTHFCLVHAARVRGQRMMATTGADSAVHPDYQGRHVYTRMREVRFAAFAERFDVRYSRGSHVAVNAARDRSGEPQLGNEVELLELRTTGLRAAIRRGGGERVPVREVDRFPPAVEALFEAVAPAFDFIVERSAPWLNWRYADRRGGPAVILAAGADEAWRGYAVLRLNRDRATLSDLVALPGDEDALASLLTAVRRAAGARNIRVVRGWMPRRHPYREASLRAGFRSSGQAIDLRYAPSRAEAAAIAFLGDEDARIHLMLGDTDGG
jgi:hypothetical protein